MIFFLSPAAVNYVKLSFMEKDAGRPAFGRITGFVLKNIPFFVLQIVVVCCLVADIAVVKQPRFAVSAVPIEALAFAYLKGANAQKQQRGKEQP